MALFRTLQTPTYDFLPNLRVEICLVLALDVNFFLNSRKQGLPCWRSLSFFLNWFRECFHCLRSFSFLSNRGQANWGALL